MKNLKVVTHPATFSCPADIRFKAPWAHAILAVATVLIFGISVAWSAVPSAGRQDPLLSEALEAHNLGDVKKAVEIYSEYLQKVPNSAEARNWRGMAYDDLGDYRNALADFNRAIELSPKYAEPYNNRGEVYRKQKDYAKALADYQKALQLEKDFVEPRFNIAIVQEAQGQPQLAARSLLTYLKINPDAEDREQVLTKIRQLAQNKPSAPPPAVQKPGPPRPGAPAPPPQAAATPTAPQAPAQPLTAQPPAAPPKKKFTPGVPVQPQSAQPTADDLSKLAEGLPIGGDIIALVLGLGAIALAIPLLIYLFLALMLFLIARKTNTDMAWLAFIPIANLYLMVRISGKPIWWFAAILVPWLLSVIVNALGILPAEVSGMVSGLLSLISYALMLVIFLRIAAARGKSAIWGVLAWLPCTFPIGMAYLGLSK